MRFVTQLLTGFVFFVVGALILLHFMPGSATFARKIGIPEAIVSVVAREVPDAGPGNNSRRGQNASGPLVVVVKPASDGKVNDRLKAIGDGDAIRSVAVTPLVSGQISELRIRPGQKVKAGDVIARLDDDVEKIAVSKAKVILEGAKSILRRSEDLKKIISRADYDIAERAVDTARLAVAEAELNLARRAVLSPVTGIAGIVNFSVGDYVTFSSAIVTIDDRSRLLVDFWVPERFTGLIREGMTVQANPIARPGEVYSGTISAIDNRIDAASRTLHIQAEIPNENDQLRAGQSFEVVLNLGGDTWPAVDPLAIQWDSSGSYVWRVKDHKVERVAASVIERNPDKVLVDAAIKPGDMIVTEGLQRLSNGATVKIFGEKEAADKVADANKAAAQ
ncbi:efflux RND transporter periplasmic adaptor subunit [Rhizobium sp. KVB221]|uniref:Efflux RND transporter periplasmic adaptor subunit n=1 Tax=Rhizobium setariae TaxID=2801340 RepID=A0A937CQG0_9HYPH|nr:efflux RND transporter periplasmic adaptor subunit [Rhizobium setariae]MBL0374424.1 efflux RND transporter periplasmic adaptor subunit [Rhizobium setariae]